MQWLGETGPAIPQIDGARSYLSKAQTSARCPHHTLDDQRSLRSPAHRQLSSALCAWRVHDKSWSESVFACEGENTLYSLKFDGGRTRARTLDPLIKRNRVIRGGMEVRALWQM